MTCGSPGGFPRDELAERIAPIAKRLNLRAGTKLDIRETIYFPVDGIATLVLEREHARFQIGFATRGDVIGLQGLFTSSFPPILAEVFRPGAFISVSAKQLGDLVASDSGLRERLAVYALRASAHFLDEAAETIALTLERRVARWIARCRDILGNDLIAVTHHDLSRTLGVRRSGVTVALHVLEGEHLIRSKRGRIEVVDHGRLLAFARTGSTPYPGSSPPPSARQAAADTATISPRIAEDNLAALT